MPAGMASISSTLLKVEMKYINLFDIDIDIMRYMLEKSKNMSIETMIIEFHQHGQWKCAITGQKLTIGNMECHHKMPKRAWRR